MVPAAVPGSNRYRFVGGEPFARSRNINASRNAERVLSIYYVHALEDYRSSDTLQAASLARVITRVAII